MNTMASSVSSVLPHTVIYLVVLGLLLQPCCVQTLVAVVSFACLAKNSVMVYLLTAHHY